MANRNIFTHEDSPRSDGGRGGQHVVCLGPMVGAALCGAVGQ
jgi:hypothetical protein